MFIKFKSNRIIVFKTDIVSNCIDIWKFNNLYWYLKFFFFNRWSIYKLQKKIKKKFNNIFI